MSDSRSKDEARFDAATLRIDESSIIEGPGTVIGRYKLLEQVGEGGFGVVYVAEQREPVKRRVALKIIKLGMDTRQVVARFEAERQALALMDHPNIAKVLDAGTTDTGRPFFVMELVRGIKVTEYCDQSKLSTHERIKLFIQICHAIQHAHQKGIIHRDIKPSNILVTLHDGVPVPKVIDFGIAKATQQELTEKTLYTQLQQFIGTPAYMSPEQAEMSGLDVDTRSDIYSLGVLLYELLTGQTPFDPKELMKSGVDAMRKTIREREPQRPSTKLNTLQRDELTTTAKRRGADAPKLLHLVKGDLDWIVMKCLEKDRTRRYETASGLAADLNRHLNNEPVVARPPSAAYRLQKSLRRNKVAFAATGAIVFALLFGLITTQRQAVRARRAERQQVQLRQAAENAREGEAAQRAKAESARESAETNATKAAVNEVHARRLLYAADMNLAQQALKANNLGRARRLLDRHRPQASVAATGEGRAEDPRGWEWRYLWQQCQGGSLVMLTQRTERANSVSFSPDGNQLAVGYWDGRVELWDVLARRLIKVLHERSGVAGYVAFSPHTNALAATAERGVVKRWDLATGNETTLCKLSGLIRDIAFSRDGKLMTVLSWGLEPAAVVLDVAEGRLVSSNSVPRGGGAHVHNARVSPDHQQLYLSSWNFTRPRLQCLRMADGQVLWEVDGGTDLAFTAMDISPDGQFLVTATGYAESTIRIWNAHTGQLVGTLQGHTGWVAQLAFSSDGEVLASASTDQTIRLWETATWKETAVLRGHGDEVQGVAMTRDKRLLASGSKDGAVMLWDGRAKKPAGGRQSLPARVAAAWALAGGQTVLAMNTNRTWSVFDLQTLAETALPVFVKDHSAFAPPNYLAVYDQSNRCQLYAVAASGARRVGEVDVGPAFRSDFAYSEATRLFAWTTGRGTNQGAVFMASLDEPATRIELSVEADFAYLVRFSADGRFLLGLGKTPYVWDVTTRGRVTALERRLGDARAGRNLDMDDSLLKWLSPPTASEISDATLPPTNTPARFKPRGPLSGIAYSPDGRTFALSSQAGIAVLYDTERNDSHTILHGHMQAVFAVAFSPDGRRVASTSGAQEAVKLWDVITGQELLTLPGEGSLLGRAEFTDDGNTLLVGSTRQAGLCQFWRAPSWKEIEDAEHSGGGWARMEER